MTKKIKGEFAVSVEVPSEGVTITLADGGIVIFTVKAQTQQEAENALKRLSTSLAAEA